MTEADDLGRRKADHIDLCVDEHVEGRCVRTLLGDVDLVHDALPELAFDEIDVSTTLLGRTLRVPILISGMTGGIDRAGEINRVLATVAEELGMGFGVGSQRPMALDPAAVASYRVRDVAPTALLLANIGAVQAAAMSAAALEDLAGAIGADALCIHMNAGQELVQPGGDRDFRGCLGAIARATADLPIPVIAKETGCGVSRRVALRLAEAGIRTVDISGAGGTTWVGVETLRGSREDSHVGDALWDWGVPTAAAVAYAVDAGLETIASGGIRTGLDAARALALGASAASAALPFLRAAAAGGEVAVRETATAMLRTLRTTMLLTGSANVAALRTAPRVIGADLERWIALR